LGGIFPHHHLCLGYEAAFGRPGPKRLEVHKDFYAVSPLGWTSVQQQPPLLFPQRCVASMNTLKTALVIVLAFVASTAQAIQIGGIALTDLGAGVVPNAINNNGQVVGQDASGQAFMWDGTMHSVGGGTQSCANDINDSGEVVGWFSSSTFNTQFAFKWTSSTGTVMLWPGGGYNASAEAVSNSGTVVGWINSGGVTQSAEWSSGGTMTALFSSTTNHKAMGIDNTGEVVGVQIDSSGNPVAGYYWSGHGNTGNWTSSFPTFFPLAGLTNSGATAGQYSSSSQAAYLPVLIGGQALWVLPKLSASDLSALAFGLNDEGSVVGESGGKGFLYDTTTLQLYNMSDFLPPLSPFTQLTALNDIGNSNEFIGVGLVDGVQHGFVGQITPEPSIFVLLGIGSAALLAWACWRRRRGQASNLSH
jgi:probable HAF family extracellular repeat protein